LLCVLFASLAGLVFCGVAFWGSLVLGLKALEGLGLEICGF